MPNAIAWLPGCSWHYLLIIFIMISASDTFFLIRSTVSYKFDYIQLSKLRTKMKDFKKELLNEYSPATGEEFKDRQVSRISEHRYTNGPYTTDLKEKIHLKNFMFTLKHSTRFPTANSRIHTTKKTEIKTERNDTCFADIFTYCPDESTAEDKFVTTNFTRKTHRTEKKSASEGETECKEKPTCSTTCTEEKPTCSTTCTVEKPTCFTTCTEEKPTCSTTCTEEKTTCSTTCTEEKPTCSTTCTEEKPTCSTTCTEEKPTCSTTCTKEKPTCYTTCTEEKTTCSTTCTEEKPTCSTTCTEEKPTCSTTCTEEKPICSTTCTEEEPICSTTCTEEKPTCKKEKPCCKTAKCKKIQIYGLNNTFHFHLNNEGCCGHKENIKQDPCNDCTKVVMKLTDSYEQTNSTMNTLHNLPNSIKTSTSKDGYFSDDVMKITSTSTRRPTDRFGFAKISEPTPEYSSHPQHTEGQVNRNNKLDQIKMMNLNKTLVLNVSRGFPYRMRAYNRIHQFPTKTKLENELRQYLKTRNKILQKAEFGRNQNKSSTKEFSVTEKTTENDFIDIAISLKIGKIDTPITPKFCGKRDTVRYGVSAKRLGKNYFPATSENILRHLIYYNDKIRKLMVTTPSYDYESKDYDEITTVKKYRYEDATKEYITPAHDKSSVVPENKKTCLHCKKLIIKIQKNNPNVKDFFGLPLQKNIHVPGNETILSAEKKSKCKKICHKIIETTTNRLNRFTFCIKIINLNKPWPFITEFKPLEHYTSQRILPVNKLIDPSECNHYVDDYDDYYDDSQTHCTPTTKPSATCKEQMYDEYEYEGIDTAYEDEMVPLTKSQYEQPTTENYVIKESKKKRTPAHRLFGDAALPGDNLGQKIYDVAAALKADLEMKESKIKRLNQKEQLYKEEIENVDTIQKKCRDLKDGLYEVKKGYMRKLSELLGLANERLQGEKGISGKLNEILQGIG